MKRGFLLGAFFLIFFIIFSFNVAEGIISGYATSQGLNVSIQIVGTPSVNVIYPANASYSSHVTEFNYTVISSNLDSCWYSLNGGANNFSVICGNNVSGITSSEGSNTWKVYANNSEGEGSDSVTFVVTISGGSGTGTTGGTGGGGSTGGGVGGGTPEKKEFLINPEEFNILILAGEEKNYEIEVTNPRSSQLEIDIETKGISEFLALSENKIVLEAGEKKKVSFIVSAPESGIYAGKIIFRTGYFEKEVFIILNIRSSDALFDVSLTVPSSYRVIKPGQDLRAFVSLLQIGEAEKVDVSVNYLIKDFEGAVLYTESETFAVFKSKSYVKEFLTAKFPVGDYIVGIEVNYPEGFATSSAHFTVAEEKRNIWLIAFISLAVLTILAVIFAILKYKRYNKLRNRGDKK